MPQIITDPIECKVSRRNGTPVFVLPAVQFAHKYYKRILGAEPVKEYGVWIFPAFYPFAEDTLRDMKLVVPELIVPEEVEEHVRNETVCAGIPDDFTYVTTPYEHQKDALKFVIGMRRAGVFYDMGLGKTKVVIDLLRHLKQKALVLSPLVGVRNFVHEVDIHSGGELRTTALLGETAAGKQAKKVASAERRKLNAALKQAKKDNNEQAVHEIELQIEHHTGPTRAAKIADICASDMDADILVTTYDTAKAYVDVLLEKFAYTVIIADESHSLRTHNSGRTKAALALADKADRRIIMSGTPSLGNPMHFFGQLAFLGKFVPAVNWWKYKKYYTVPQKGNPKFIAGYKNLDMLNDKIQRVAIRRKKEECLDLPDRTIVDVPFAIDGDQRDMYNDLVENACVDLGGGVLYEPAHAAITLQKLMQVLSGFFIKPPPDICDGCKDVQFCVDHEIKPFTKRCNVEQVPREQSVLKLKSNPKLEALSELLDMVLAEDRNKCIIWAHFIGELDSVEALLTSKGIEYVRVDGSNSKHAPDLARTFSEDPDIRVYVGQIATGIAINLTAATYTVYYGLNYRLDHYLQSMDRNYRIGSTLPVTVYRMICPNSVIDYVARSLARNIDVAETLASKIDCLLCGRNIACLESDIQPFTKECIYKERVSRVVTRPAKL